ncbi:hypothetical protein KK137_09055 [Croceibacterium sp. LX-88]|uniref:Uncharacterized protein n=1 Tax=Croceibacterium selenioxidans TaxID=2838833 RepID=A0ABS5W466_9SPHN|nr:hypothetical protein [Croceibacterium selenioxidans]MBT2134479.1 hypothetical protein [Croceibacterium selenioxidans]
MTKDKKWFTKVGSAYVPNNFEGCLFILLIVVLYFIFFGITIAISKFIDEDVVLLLRVFIFVVLLLTALAVGNRRS